MNRHGVLSWAAGWLAALALALGAGPGAGADAAVIADPVTFGIVLPLTGDRDVYGRSLLTGMQARARQINAAGGVLGGRPVAFEIVDTESRPDRAAGAVDELAGRPGVLAIFGPHTSGEFAAMLGPARERGLAVIAPKATQNGITRGNPWAFRITFSNGFQGMAMARFLTEKRGLGRFALLTDRRHGYTTDLAEAFRETVEGRGAGTIVADVAFGQDGGEDFGPAIGQIAQADPEAVFISAYADDVQDIVRQAGRAGLRAVLCGGDSWDVESVLQGSGFRLEGSYYIANFSLASPDPAVAAFAESMREAGLEVPDSTAALGYDTVTVGVLALERAAEPTRRGIRDALPGLSDLPLITGKTTITPEGEALKSVYIMKVVREGDALSAVEAERLDP